MVTVVILSVGILGIFRAFLISLNYQQYLLTRLYVMNFLTDELAKTEGLWLSKGSFSRGSIGEVVFPVDARSKFVAERAVVPQSAETEIGLDRIDIKLFWRDGDINRKFQRSTLAYYNDEKK